MIRAAAIVIAGLGLATILSQNTLAQIGIFAAFNGILYLLIRNR